MDPSVELYGREAKEDTVSGFKEVSETGLSHIKPIPELLNI